MVTVSSVAERENAERLRRLIIAAWPGIDRATNDQVTIAAGIRLVREADLLVTIELENPRRCTAGDVYAGIVVIETKALDLSRFKAVGNDLLAIYYDGLARHTILEQLDGQILAMRRFLDRYGDRCFVHGLVWLLSTTSADLDERIPFRSPLVLGSDASWSTMLDAAAGQHASIVHPASAQQRASVHALCNRLTTERQLSARDLAKLDRLTTEVLCRDVLDDVLSHAGGSQVRLLGRAGSGKSTMLALAARRIFERDEGRLLFHHLSSSAAS